MSSAATSALRAAEEWTVRARGLNPDAAVRMLAAWKALASSG